MARPTLVRDLTAPLDSSGAVRISRPRRRNWWIETVYQTWRDANDAWLAARESDAFMQWEDDEYREAYPPPRLKDFLIEMSPKRQRDYQPAALHG